MTMITPSYLGETIEYSSLHACRSTLEDPTCHEMNCYSGVEESVRRKAREPIMEEDIVTMLSLLRDSGSTR